MASLLSSLRPGCSSSSPALTRSIKHVSKAQNPPKFKQLLHPEGWSKVLPSGATFVYNPPPSSPSTQHTNLLDGTLAPTGKRLPAGWRKEGGFGHLAPRLDRKPEGAEPAQRVNVPMEVREQMRALRLEDPAVWTTSSLRKRFVPPPFVFLSLINEKMESKNETLPPSFSFLWKQRFNVSALQVAKYAPAPTKRLDELQKAERERREGLTLRRLVGIEARQIRKGMW